MTTPERCQEPQSPRTAPSMPLSMQLLTGSASPLTALTAPPKLASFSCPIQKPPHSPRAKLFFSCLRSSSQAPLAVIHFYRTRLRPILGPSRPPPPPTPHPRSQTYLHKQLKNHIYPNQKSMGTSSQTLQDRGPGLPKLEVCRPLGSSTPSKLS